VISFFAIGFAVWQPAAQLLFHSLLGWPLSFHSMREWWSFAMVSFIIGALVGAAWSIARGLKEGWWRDWLEMLPRVTAFDLIFSGRAFVHDRLPVWLLGIAVAALVTTTIFTFVYRIARSSLRTAAGK
jgi:hypothetical protein